MRSEFPGNCRLVKIEVVHPTKYMPDCSDGHMSKIFASGVDLNDSLDLNVGIRIIDCADHDLVVFVLAHLSESASQLDQPHRPRVQKSFVVSCVEIEPTVGLRCEDDERDVGGKVKESLVD